MGADGHIRIYDFEKFKDNYDEEVVDSFLGHCLSSVFYQQELLGKQYLTRYHGDNLGVDDMYDVVRRCYDKESDTFNTKSWNYDRYSADYFMKLHQEHRHAFYDMIKYLEKECILTSWEVWT